MNQIIKFSKLKLNQTSKFIYSSLSKFNFSVIGLNIGGTSTCMAILEPSGPRVIENSEGLRTTPSYISFQEGLSENDILIGVNSKKLSFQLGKSTFFGSRHFLSMNQEEIKNLINKKRFPFEVYLNEDGNYLAENILFKNPYGNPLSPIKQTSLFLKYCKDQADGLLGKNIKKVVLSIPSELNNTTSQKYLIDALGAVDLKPISFIEESKSVLIGYNIISDKDKNGVLVFNLGGTGFSLSYLKRNIKEKDKDKEKEAENKDEKDTNTIDIIEEVNKFEVKYHYSNSFLGGDDIDSIITKYLIEEFEKKNRADPTKEISAMQRLREAAEIAKTELSSSNQVEINLPFLMADHKGPKHLQIGLTKSKFERLIDEFIMKLKKECNEFKNKFSQDDQIDDILLSGGMTRSPIIQEIVKSIFNKEPNRLINPEEAGAIGACIIADTYNKNFEEKVNFSKLPLSIGIETIGGVMSKLLEKDTSLPNTKTFKLTNVYDNQPSINIKFYMGERVLCEDNRVVGDINMKIPLGKKGEIVVDLNIKCTEEGILNVKMTETLSKKSSVYSVDLSNGLTNEIIEDVLSVSNKYKEIDEYSKRDRSLRKELDDFIYEINKEISILKDKEKQVNDKEIDLLSIENIISEMEIKLSYLNEDNQQELLGIYNNLKENIEKILQ